MLVVIGGLVNLNWSISPVTLMLLAAVGAGAWATGLRRRDRAAETPDPTVVVLTTLVALVALVLLVSSTAGTIDTVHQRPAFDRHDDLQAYLVFPHTMLETGEIYLSLKGQGLMMMKLPDGTCRSEEFVPGRLVYVPPYWAHRSINTAEEPLVSLCIYPGDAGHNYGDIETEGFPKRVFKRNGQIYLTQEED